MRATQRPNLFLVGAPKCATTSMDAYLAQHPEIYMSPRKESHLFARDLYPDGTQCTWERYCSFFDGVTDEPVRGESSVFYLLSRTAAAALADYAPDAKILVMLRNPLDVLESHHSQIVYEGLESEPDVARAVRLEPVRKAACPPDRAIYKDRVLHYLDVVRFGEQLARFRAHFAPGQIHTVIYDDLKADPAREYAKVLAFLGVDPTFQPAFERINANKAVRSAKLRTLLYETPDLLTRVSRIVLPNYTVRRRVRNAIKRLNTNYKQRQGMPAALRREVAQALQGDIADLSDMLGRDLSPWLADHPLPGADAEAGAGPVPTAAPAHRDQPARLSTG